MQMMGKGMPNMPGMGGNLFGKKFKILYKNPKNSQAFFLFYF